MAAPNTFHPTQIGWNPPNSTLGSQIIIGKDVSANWEAIGFGSEGRPDILQKLVINFTNGSSKKASITIDVASLPANPTTISMELREVAVCDGGVEKKMLILASQTYTTS